MPMQPLEQAYGRAVIVDSLPSVQLGTSRSAVYDRQIGLHALYADPDSGAEHYLIRHPAGFRTRNCVALGRLDKPAAA
jgi:hypothetical protein